MLDISSHVGRLLRSSHLEEQLKQHGARADFGFLMPVFSRFGFQSHSQHAACAITRDGGQRVIDRFRLTKGDDVCNLFHGVSFLLEVLAGLDTRHDTPPSQTPSPSFPHSSCRAASYQIRTVCPWYCRGRSRWHGGWKRNFRGHRCVST